VVEISKDTSSTQATFLPAVPGKVVVSASMDYLPPIDQTLDVIGLPPLLIGLSCIGALIGSLLAFFERKRSSGWAVALGIVAGLTLYWAYVFGVLPLPHYHGSLLNPLSALFLPILGGWLGKGVFGAVTRGMGLPQDNNPGTTRDAVGPNP